MPTTLLAVKLVSEPKALNVRICSFLPSATEILYALGLGEAVAGVTYECDFPPEVRGKPVVVHTRLAASGSAEIDRRVKEFVATGESLYRVDLETLSRLAPDLIITQDLCHVCAASPGDLPEALARLPQRPRVVSLTPKTLSEVFGDIRRLGEATGRAAAAAELVAQLESEGAEVDRAVANRPQPRVLCLEWLDPPYVGGHWVPEMVARAGGLDVLGRASEPSRQLTFEEILATRPEVVVLMPCGYGLAQTVEEFRRTKFPTAWSTLPAVVTGRLFAVDANSYFSRPGPRLVTGLRLLASFFHPDAAPFSPPPDAAAAL
ncbi:MAG: cobalamin-binding protein [Candidatus Acidiferrales bacterium]